MQMEAVLDYYSGAYGPTIRFDTNSLDSLYILKDLFQNLFLGKTNEVKLHNLEGVKCPNIESLIITVVDTKPKVTLKCLKNKSDGAMFRWENTKEGWKYCSGLIEGLISSNKAGHQYLTNENVDDALVEVCFLE